MPVEGGRVSRRLPLTHSHQVAEDRTRLQSSHRCIPLHTYSLPQHNAVVHRGGLVGSWEREGKGGEGKRSEGNGRGRGGGEGKGGEGGALVKACCLTGGQSTPSRASVLPSLVTLAAAVMVATHLPLVW